MGSLLDFLTLLPKKHYLLLCNVCSRGQQLDNEEVETHLRRESNTVYASLLVSHFTWHYCRILASECYRCMLNQTFDLQMRKSKSHYQQGGVIMSNQNQPLVYFFAKSNFGDTNPDFIKIGYTGTELSLRRAALQTGSESPIWAMGVLPFDTEDEARREERRIHEHFGGFRACGENGFIPRLGSSNMLRIMQYSILNCL